MISLEGYDLLLCLILDISFTILHRDISLGPDDEVIGFDDLDLIFKFCKIGVVFECVCVWGWGVGGSGVQGGVTWGICFLDCNCAWLLHKNIMSCLKNIGNQLH